MSKIRQSLGGWQVFGEERKQLILDYVNKHGRASVQELSNFLQVSESTIRRDLKELEEAKLLNRTHGGAISLQAVNFEPTYWEKEDRFKSEKEAIAREAVKLIENGDTILLDSGTTTFHLVQQLKTFNHLTVVTNSLLFAQELQGNPGIEVLVTGGSLRRETLALVGPITERALEQVRVDKVFIATNGLDLEKGLTTPNLLEAAVKSKMIAAATQVILLADHSKIGRISFARFAGLADIDHCIMDAAAPVEVVMALKKKGIQVHLAQP